MPAEIRIDGVAVEIESEGVIQTAIPGRGLIFSEKRLNSQGAKVVLRFKEEKRKGVVSIIPTIERAGRNFFDCTLVNITTEGPAELKTRFGKKIPLKLPIRGLPLFDKEAYGGAPDGNKVTIQSGEGSITIKTISGLPPTR